MGVVGKPTTTESIAHTFLFSTGPHARLYRRTKFGTYSWTLPNVRYMTSLAT